MLATDLSAENVNCGMVVEWKKTVKSELVGIIIGSIPGWLQLVWLRKRGTNEMNYNR